MFVLGMAMMVILLMVFGLEHVHGEEDSIVLDDHDDHDDH